jgi:hypothetical protein
MKFREAMLGDLIIGLTALFSAIAMIFYVWGKVLILASGEGYIILMPKGLFEIMLAMVILGLVAGYEIGRYVEFSKKRLAEK